MSPTARTVARFLTPTLFLGACAGWIAGLLQVQATASTPALLLSTTCGMLAVATLMTWAKLRGVPTR